ncbi:C40 family peptidase [Azospirillum sp. ST 5-10]|uniref:C40 family peptidase n=1 Tax=unclassified Azospirillum TaxID=2630922 RepID=UPI003F4A1168
MSGPLDPRRHPWRPDLAAAHLRGRVEAARFVDGREHQVTAGVAGMRGSPDPAARQTSEVLYGEGFTVYDRCGGWAWGQCATDGYVGWVPEAALDAGRPAPTHLVADLAAFRFPEPDLKTPPLDSLPLGSRLRAVGERGGYVELADGGWLYARHLAPVDAVEPDLVATAQRLLGVPYLWGGRTPRGIDCSGLAQLALLRAGVACPRDSDMQRAEVGEPVPGTAYRRGDLVFFPGHVGLMLDGERLLHATAFTMTVTVEPLDAVAQRVDPTRAGGILGVRRVMG